MKGQTWIYRSIIFILFFKLVLIKGCAYKEGSILIYIWYFFCMLHDYTPGKVGDPRS